MIPELIPGTNDVRAACPTCRAISIWHHRDEKKEYGQLFRSTPETFKGRNYKYHYWRLLRCSSCDRGGLSKVFTDTQEEALAVFFPTVIPPARLPRDVPDGIVAEFREAETCAGAGALRACSAMVRSTLEKALAISGYSKGSLRDKIDTAADDGVITEARKRKAHEDIRVLGNEVVHDEWRELAPDEVEKSLHYAQRILEDLYDDRIEVEKLLVAAKRLPSS